MSEERPGYLATPESGSGPGVLVLHAWWGMNADVRTVCDRLAGEGFTAYAPDLYDGRIASDILQAETLSSALDADSARRIVSEGAEFLSRRTGSDAVAVLGFSLGAFFALDLSAARPELVKQCVVFYGTGPADFRNARASYLGHFAETDPYEPRENVEALEAELRKAGRPVQWHVYPGTGHWFFEPGRTDAYDAAAAALAWERTVEFLK